MTKYTFRTIVAPDAVRADFTVLRDQLNSSDKELMQAFWNLGIDRLDDIKREVEMLQASAAQARAEKQEIKAAAKLKEKAAAAEKKKAPKAEEEFVDDGEDDIETVVVDGTR
jgi:peptidoglycan hydrolase CwlO-like protein